MIYISKETRYIICIIAFLTALLVLGLLALLP